MPSKLAALLEGPDRGWLDRADMLLAETSWDRTWAEMTALIDEAQDVRRAPAASGGLKCSIG
jgi:hypothetical protein